MDTQKLFEVEKIDRDELGEYLNTLEIKIITPEEASILNNKWHRTLPKIEVSNITRNKYYACFSIVIKNIIVGVAIWTSPVSANRMKNGYNKLELRRYALSEYAPRNTGSKAMKLMISVIKKNFPQIQELITYQEVKFHHGSLYKAMNWKQDKYIKYKPWNTKSRTRNPTPESDKIRWVYPLKQK